MRTKHIIGDFEGFFEAEAYTYYSRRLYQIQSALETIDFPMHICTLDQKDTYTGGKVQLFMPP
jgi:hypothetical protein